MAAIKCIIQRIAREDIRAICQAFTMVTTRGQSSEQESNKNTIQSGRQLTNGRFRYLLELKVLFNDLLAYTACARGNWLVPDQSPN